MEAASTQAMGQYYQQQQFKNRTFFSNKFTIVEWTNKQEK